MVGLERRGVPGAGARGHDVPARAGLGHVQPPAGTEVEPARVDQTGGEHLDLGRPGAAGPGRHRRRRRAGSGQLAVHSETSSTAMAWSAPATGRLAVTVPVAGSIRWTVRSWPPTQTAVRPTAMNAGSPASGIRPAALAVVRSALGLNRSTSRARWLGTQTEPKPMATPGAGRP